MKILIVTQYFWPESFIINDLARTLAAQGHSVQVLTGKPNYPEGKVFTGYVVKGCMNESFDNIPVYRVPLRPRGSGRAINLALNYFSFVWNGLLFFHRKVKNHSYDTILVFAISPLTAAIPAIYLKWRLKTHLAVWVQDLWPESLSATGFVRNKLLLYCVGWMVRAIYAGADTLLVSSEAFKEPICDYAPISKLAYYPNPYQDQGFDPTLVTQIPKWLLSELEQNFCMVFAGNLGTAQSVETLVEAAEKLQFLIPDCRLVLVGNGSMSAWLEKQKIKRNLANLILAGRFPVAEMPHFFQRAAGLIVTLKRAEIFTYTIPSKVQAYLAAGRPIVAALDGEGSRIVEAAGAGLSCPAEDAAGLANCIQELFHMSSSERNKMGEAGRAYFLKYFEIQRQSHRLIEILENRLHITKEQSK